LIVVGALLGAAADVGLTALNRTLGWQVPTLAWAAAAAIAGFEAAGRHLGRSARVGAATAVLALLLLLAGRVLLWPSVGYDLLHESPGEWFALVAGVLGCGALGAWFGHGAGAEAQRRALRAEQRAQVARWRERELAEAADAEARIHGSLRPDA
jgi:uncharacterized membrane protein YoaK (UPF0700 family)